ncbi:hypothetical protein PINS_up020884 [Pythium insidiosum]|nr:hypothetical protein PINS_up020884 [Pythium insidiosum]
MAYFGQPAQHYDSGSACMPTWAVSQHHTPPVPGYDITSSYLLQLQHELGYASEAYEQFISVMRAYHSRMYDSMSFLCCSILDVVDLTRQCAAESAFKM